MGSSRKLFLLLGILFVVLFLSSSEVAPAKGFVHAIRTAGYNSLTRPQTPITECVFHPNYIPCKVPPVPSRRRCYYGNNCRRGPPGRAGEFTNDQFKDDFHN